MTPSLEPLESNPPIPPAHIDRTGFHHSRYERPADITPLQSDFRHGGWAPTRQRVYDALMATQQPSARINSFANCGSSIFLHASPDGEKLRMTCNSCHDRFCEPCQRRRRYVISAAVEAAITGKVVRFVTLTLRVSDCPLRDQLDRLYRDFSVLRRRAWWKDHVEGGAAFCEVKLGKNSGGWHCHLHLLVEGVFMPQRELSKEWNAVTGDSFIVDVRECTDPKGRAAYVTKYVTKPADSSVFKDAAKLAEFVAAIKGRRLCLTFGTWRGVQLEPDKVPEGEWITLGSIETVAARAAAGDPASLRILGEASKRWGNILVWLDAAESTPPSTA